MHAFARTIGVLALFMVVSGCGGEKGAPVSGHVTINGKPLANATVMFQPIAEGKSPGMGSAGKTDASGNYTLNNAGTRQPGAVVGKHMVLITAPEDSLAGLKLGKAKRLPDKYNNKSTLKYEVPAQGTTSANFDLTVP
jgi:hypothetical protein